MPSDNRGFSVFALDSPQEARTIRKKLEIRRAELASVISEGGAQDWADYKSRVGVLQGIDEALHVCDEVLKDERS